MACTCVPLSCQTLDDWMGAMNARHFLASLWLSSLAVTAGAESGAHEHGVAHLHLVQDGAALSVEFESPLDSLVGFEHAPRDDAHKQALRISHEALENAAQMVSLPAAAGCAVDTVEVEMPFVEDAHHDHLGKGEHADAQAHYTFNCTEPSALTQLTVGLFKAFPRLERIDAEAATAAGQGKAVLRPTQATWTLPAPR